MTFSEDELKNLLGDTSNVGIGSLGDSLVRSATSTDPDEEVDIRAIPGMLLNRLNPLKGLDDEQRKAFISEFRHKSEAFGNRDLRLALMDEQGIDKALMFPAAAHDIEYEFADNIPALYANIRAFNRWMHEEVGYVAQNRMFLPPYIALADPDLAVAELEQVMADGATIDPDQVGPRPRRGRPTPSAAAPSPIRSTTGSGRSSTKPSIRLAVHLGGTDYQKYGADWSEDPEAVFGDFDAFQWVDVLGRPAGHGADGRPHPPQLLRPVPEHQGLPLGDGHGLAPLHPAQDGPRLPDGPQSKWSESGRLDRRPSEIFREHFIVAPYPEENVRRVVDEVGIEPIVFGSDFPHGEGLAFPDQYVDAQLTSFNDDDQRRIMRDNLEKFLAPALR